MILTLINGVRNLCIRLFLPCRNQILCIFTVLFNFMRLDLFLKASRLVIRRSLAQELCSAGNVKINGIMARSSRDVKLNDKIELKRRNKLTTFRVAEVPDKKQVSREQAANLYEIISEEFLEESPFPFPLEVK